MKFLRQIFLLLGILALLASVHGLRAMNDEPLYDEKMTEKFRNYMNGRVSAFRKNKIRKGNIDLSEIYTYIEHDADPNTATDNTLNGIYALHFAAEAGDISLIAFLLKHGANIEARSRVGTTALHVAARAGHKETVAILARFGADIEAKGKNDWTPLTYACHEGNKKCAIQLIELGAHNSDSIFRKANGQTACLFMTYAYEKILFPEYKLHREIRLKSDNIIIAQVLDDQCINQLDAQGQTALNVALVTRNISGAQFLLSKAADPSIGLYDNLRLSSRVPELRQRSVENRLSVFEEIFKIYHTKHYMVISQIEGVPKDIFFCIICFWLLLK